MKYEFPASIGKKKMETISTWCSNDWEWEFNKSQWHPAKLFYLRVRTQVFWFTYNGNIRYLALLPKHSLHLVHDWAVHSGHISNNVTLISNSNLHWIMKYLANWTSLRSSSELHLAGRDMQLISDWESEICMNMSSAVSSISQPFSRRHRKT